MGFEGVAMSTMGTWGAGAGDRTLGPTQVRKPADKTNRRVGRPRGVCCARRDPSRRSLRRSFPLWEPGARASCAPVAVALARGDRPARRAQHRHRIGARCVDRTCRCFLRFGVRRGRNERILAVDEEALIVWQDVLDMVVNGRPNEVACPHCNHRPLTIEEVDQSTRISCSKCGKFIQGRFTH